MTLWFAPGAQSTELHQPGHLLFFIKKNYDCSSGCEMVSNCGFDLHFPKMTTDIETFHVLVGHLYILFGQMSFQIRCPFFNWLSFLLSCKSFLYIFWILTSYQIYDLQIFSVACYFILLAIFFGV